MIQKYLKPLIRIAAVGVMAATILSPVNVVHAAQTDLKDGVAVTTGSYVRLRDDGSFDGKTITYSNKGEFVVVIEAQGDWYKVLYNNQLGYMHRSYLDFTTRENVELGYGKVIGTVVNVRSKPTTSGYNVIDQVFEGEMVYIIGINEGWYKIIVNDRIGYIRSDYVELTEMPYENVGSAKQPLFFKNGKLFVEKVDVTRLHPSAMENPDKNDVPESNEHGSGEQISSELGSTIVATAEKYLGVPYVWGGTTPNGFDCSGFVYYVVNQSGYELSRSMSAQYKAGTPVGKDELQPGDLVFFQNTYTTGMSHTGIYVGNGQFIHAPSSGKTVSYADLNSNYYVNHWYGACRLG